MLGHKCAHAVHALEHMYSFGKLDDVYYVYSYARTHTHAHSLFLHLFPLDEAHFGGLDLEGGGGD